MVQASQAPMDPTRAQTNLTEESDAVPNYFFNFDLGPGFSKPQEIRSLKEEQSQRMHRSPNDPPESPGGFIHASHSLYRRFPTMISCTHYKIYGDNMLIKLPVYSPFYIER
jgi:hypothetical protein